MKYIREDWKIIRVNNYVQNFVKISPYTWKS